LSLVLYLLAAWLGLLFLLVVAVVVIAEIHERSSAKRRGLEQSAPRGFSGF
jgi:hypothetical protein